MNCEALHFRNTPNLKNETLKKLKQMPLLKVIYLHIICPVYKPEDKRS